MVIEQEVRKGPEGNATVVARADLLRRDVSGPLARRPGVGLVSTPIGEAIGKLADVADRQLQLMELGNHPAIRRGAIVPLATDHSTAVEVLG